MRQTTSYTWQWFGGSSYADPGPTDVEYAESTREIVRACRSRYENRDGRTPCVEYYRYDESDPVVAYAWIGRIDDTTDAYPDYIVTFGPRGGWHCAKA